MQASENRLCLTPTRMTNAQPMEAPQRRLLIMLNTQLGHGHASPSEDVLDVLESELKGKGQE